MPTSVASALLIYGAVLTALSPVAAAVVAGLGLLVELSQFYLDGTR